MFSKKVSLSFGLAFSLMLSACGGGAKPTPTKTTNTTPAGDDYQVSQAYWSENITALGYLGANSNLTLDYSSTTGEYNYKGHLKNNNGKLHLLLSEDSLNYSQEMYIEMLTDGSYDLYSERVDGWVKTHYEKEDYEAYITAVFIFIVPFPYSEFTYNEQTKTYDLEAYDFMYKGQKYASFADISIGFVDNKLDTMKFIFGMGDMELNTTIKAKNWGSTSVSLPDASPAITPTPTFVPTPTPTIDLFTGKALAFKPDTLDNVDFYDERYDEAWANEHLSSITIRFFDNEESLFEMDAKENGRLSYAYFGTYNVINKDFAEVELTAYYNAKTGKYYHGENMSKTGQPVLDIREGFYFDEENSVYFMDSYMYADEGRMIAKGQFIFEETDFGNPPFFPEDPHDDENQIVFENKVYQYRRVEPSDRSIDTSSYVQTSLDNVISFFDDSYFEFFIKGYLEDGEYKEDAYTYCGYYSVETFEDIIVSLNSDSRVKYGEVLENNDLFEFIYDEENNELRERFILDEGQYVDVVYALTNRMPELVSKDLFDNYDEEMVNTLLAALGYYDPIPKLNNVAIFNIDDVDYEEKSFTINMIMSSSKHGQSTYYNYTSALQGDFGYTLQWTEDNAGIYYLSLNRQFELYTNYETEEYGKVTFSLKPHPVYYPSKEINQYLSERNYTDPIIEFKVSSAYRYDFAAGTLIISFDESESIDKVISGFASGLLAKQYVLKEINGITYYVSPSRQFYVNITYYPYDGKYYINLYINDISLLPEEPQPEVIYPDVEVKDYLARVTDEFIMFSHEGVTSYSYDVPDEETGRNFFSIIATLDDEYSGTSVVNGFISQLGDYAYTHTEELTATSADGKVVKMSDAYVSLNRQVAFKFIGYDKGEGMLPQYLVQILNLLPFASVSLKEEQTPQKTTISLICSQTWIVDNDAVFKAWVYGQDYGNGKWVDVDCRRAGQSTYQLSFAITGNADEAIIIRISPSTRVPDDWPQSFNDSIWNQTPAISIPEAAIGYGEATSVSFYS